MRKETRSKEAICVFCKKPITREQRPAVGMEPGKQAHVECWAKHENEATKPKPN
ncbi:MAG TPA: hypothetical protein VGS27_01750 [Candidatus Sulfotelmatobacter sp.]|nr:hypothetical protein [Candidatus Sulfotelmatobacter sp.]